MLLKVVFPVPFQVAASFNSRWCSDAAVLASSELAKVERSCGRISSFIANCGEAPWLICSKLFSLWQAMSAAFKTSPLTRASNINDSVRCPRFRGALGWFWRKRLASETWQTLALDLSIRCFPLGGTTPFLSLAWLHVGSIGPGISGECTWSDPLPLPEKDLRRLISGCCGSQSLTCFRLVSVSNGSWAVWTWGLSCYPSNSNGWFSYLRHALLPLQLPPSRSRWFCNACRASWHLALLWACPVT